MPPSLRDKPRLITDALLRKWRLPEPEHEGSKEERGRALIIAGAVEMPGAAILASTAALRAGAGKTRVAIAEAAALGVATAVPELFVLGIADGARRKESLRAVIDSARAATAVLIGPGMRDTDAIRMLFPQLLAMERLRALIIDASALPVADEFLPAAGKLRTILTPHASEMAFIAQRSHKKRGRDPLAIARDAANHLGAIVVLKGAETLICSPGGEAYLNRRGNVGLGTAGSGDVLAGFMTGLCARGVEPLQAAVWAVASHARAGELLARQRGKARLPRARNRRVDWAAHGVELR
ncbi:MAG: NAD(P)H-hydrate dehydratase [Chthoniobacterales bacterium]